MLPLQKNILEKSSNTPTTNQASHQPITHTQLLQYLFANQLQLFQFVPQSYSISTFSTTLFFPNEELSTEKCSLQPYNLSLIFT